jgi:hypothetical protein
VDPQRKLAQRTRQGYEYLPTVCGTATVRPTDGPDAGQTVSTDIPSGPGAVEVAAGDEVVLLYLQDSVERGEESSIWTISGPPSCGCSARHSP